MTKKQTNIHKDWTLIRISPEARVKIIKRVSAKMKKEGKITNMTDELDDLILNSK